MHFDFLTLFPKMLEGFLSESMLGRAQSNQLISASIHNLRNWAAPPHHQVDDRPFGGGAGMVLKPEPLHDAITELKKDNSHVIYLSPDGAPLSTPLAQSLAKKEHLIFVSGHYEGIDERIRTSVIDQEVSIGDYILTNGTLPAAVLSDAVARFIPGVLKEEKSLTQDAFSDGILSFPQYTRPAVFRGEPVPEVLLSGDHQAIEQWRQEQRILRTKARRPELLQ